jgi:hypothetical protein
MLDADTFLITLYVEVDEFCKRRTLPPRPGPTPDLWPAEALTLALFSRWSAFRSERSFFRYAQQRLRGYFPRLPHRTQFNRQMRALSEEVTAFFLFSAERLGAHEELVQALDSTALPTRNHKRRGLGWLAGEADIGYSGRLGWYEGFRLLGAVTPEGVLTGFGFAPASTNDYPLAEAFLALRRQPQKGYFAAVGKAARVYLADSGFAGTHITERWEADYRARVVAPPQRNRPGQKRAWTRGVRRWVASQRQIVETVFGALLNCFGLARERPHERAGLQVRLAASAAMHNFCIWLNRQLGRPSLAFADLCLL